MTNATQSPNTAQWMLDALLKYGRHGAREKMCESSKHSEYKCDCGFDAALAHAEEIVAETIAAAFAEPMLQLGGLTDERELDLYDEIECDLPHLFGRASAEGHEAGQRLAKEVQEKMRQARAILAQATPTCSASSDEIARSAADRIMQFACDPMPAGGHDQMRDQVQAIVAEAIGRASVQQAAHVPDELREFVEAIATTYEGDDGDGDIVCFGCHALLNIGCAHRDDCIVLRARAMIAAAPQPGEKQ